MEDFVFEHFLTQVRTFCFSVCITKQTHFIASYKTFKSQGLDNKFQDERSEGKLQTEHLRFNHRSLDIKYKSFLPQQSSDKQKTFGCSKAEKKSML